MIDIYHHVPECLLEAGEYNSEVVYDDGYSAPVEWDKVVDVAKQPACRLDLSQEGSDVIIELELCRISDAQQLQGNFVTPYRLPPTPFNGIHEVNASMEATSSAGILEIMVKIRRRM